MLEQERRVDGVPVSLVRHSEHSTPPHDNNKAVFIIAHDSASSVPKAHQANQEEQHPKETDHSQQTQQKNCNAGLSSVYALAGARGWAGVMHHTHSGGKDEDTVTVQQTATTHPEETAPFSDP